MGAAPGDQELIDDRLPGGRRNHHACEFERAYAELVQPHERGARSPIGLCSDAGAEERSFPPSPSGKPYFLCNGHLRDLFDELGQIRASETRTGTHPVQSPP